MTGAHGMNQCLDVPKGVEEGRRQKPGPGCVTTQVPVGREQTVLGSPDKFKTMGPVTLRTVFVKQVSLVLNKTCFKILILKQLNSFTLEQLNI